MEISMAPKWVRGVVFGLAALALSGCASMATTPELAVRERATSHWKARLSGDMEAAYAFMPPSYRAVTTLDGYKKGFGNAAKLTSAQVEQVKCESADKCVSTTKIEARVALARASASAVTTVYDEVWVRENGQWWVFPTQ